MLVNCVAYQTGRKVRDIQREEIVDYLRQPDSFVWVALLDPEEEELAAMQAQFGLHELAVDDARHGHQRPKIEEYGDSLFVVVHMLEFDGGELRTGEVNIFAGRNYVLSVRNRVRRGFADVRARCETEPHRLENGSGFVLYALMDAVVDRYFPILDALEEEVGADRVRHLRQGPGAAQPGSAVHVEAEAHDGEACRGAAVRGGREAAQRSRAVGLQPQPGLLPRRLRSPRPASITHSCGRIPNWSGVG